jgi:hypothetical protein
MSQFIEGMTAPIFGDVGDGNDRGRALFGDENGPDLTARSFPRKLTLFTNLRDSVAARQLNSNQPPLFKIFYLAPLEPIARVVARAA